MTDKFLIFAEIRHVQDTSFWITNVFRLDSSYIKIPNKPVSIFSQKRDKFDTAYENVLCAFPEAVIVYHEENLFRTQVMCYTAGRLMYSLNDLNDTTNIN